jgi:hypothetical protein
MHEFSDLKSSEQFFLYIVLGVNHHQVSSLLVPAVVRLLCSNRGYSSLRTSTIRRFFDYSWASSAFLAQKVSEFTDLSIM